MASYDEIDVAGNIFILHSEPLDFRVCAKLLKLIANGKKVRVLLPDGADRRSVAEEALIAACKLRCRLARVSFAPHRRIESILRCFGV